MRAMIHNLFQKLGRDERGVSAVEFALIAPVMVLFLFGSSDLSLMLTADRKVTQTASTIADLVAQDEEITSDEMDDIFFASSAIMQPYPTDKLQMRVTSVWMDGAGKVTVDWSRADGMSPRVKGSTVSVPAGILQKNTSVIFSEVIYPYSSGVTNIVNTAIDMHENFYLRPRRSTRVTGPK